jgi:integrase
MYSRYQFGSLTQKQRKRTPAVWEFRYYERQDSGFPKRKTIMLGTVAQLPTMSDALRAVEALRLQLNPDSAGAVPVTVGSLIDKYLAEELPERHSTRCSYMTVLRKWIRPKWQDHKLMEVKTIAVEQWLRSLPLAPKSKTHVRNMMHLLYQNARRWELTEKNPIEFVRQSSRRVSIPRVLTAEEVQLLLSQLVEPFRTMVMVAVCLGLRVSEIMGLQWGDFNWNSLTVLVQRSVVQGRVGETKTEYSRRPLPLDADLAALLLKHRNRSFYTQPTDWVFAGDHGRPRWQEVLLRNHIQPAAEKAGLGRIGWHTFRHSYSTLLRANGADVKVQQELLRHADIQTTMNIYTQAVSNAKREANSKVVQMVMKETPQIPMKKAAGGGLDSMGVKWERGPL